MAQEVVRNVVVEPQEGESVDIVIFDGEDGTIGEWKIYDNEPIGATIENVTEDDNKFAKFTDTGDMQNSMILYKDGKYWHDEYTKKMSFKIRANNDFQIYIRVLTEYGEKLIKYIPDEGVNYSEQENYFTHGLGVEAKDGNWHTYTVEFEKDMQECQPNYSVLEVNAIEVRGNISIDDVTLLDTKFIPKDVTAPVVTLNGESEITIPQNGTYSELGATAVDDVDGDVEVTISGFVITSEAGDYTITYSAKDSAGNEGIATRIVHVLLGEDKEAPKIHLLGANPQVVVQNSEYIEFGAYAKDGVDGDVNTTVEQNSVNTSNEGEYEVKYKAEDSKGNTAYATRKVIVVSSDNLVLDDINPVIYEDGESQTQSYPYWLPYLAPNDSKVTKVYDSDLQSNVAYLSMPSDGSIRLHKRGGTYSWNNHNDKVLKFKVKTDNNIKVTITLQGTDGDKTLSYDSNALKEFGFVSGEWSDITIDLEKELSKITNDSSHLVAVKWMEFAQGDMYLDDIHLYHYTSKELYGEDKTAPVIYLKGTYNPEIKVGESNKYVEEGAEAIDYVDGNISNSVVIDSSEVNWNTPGYYRIKYTVTDSAGNSKTVYRRVNVVVNDPYKIGVRETYSTPVEYGTVFISPNGKGDGSDINNPASFRDLLEEKIDLKAGDVVFFRGGVYELTTDMIYNRYDYNVNSFLMVWNVRGGTKSEPITYESYPGEKAIIDGSQIPLDYKRENGSVLERALLVDGDYSIFRKFDITKMPNWGFRVFGCWNIFEGMNGTECKLSAFETSNGSNPTNDRAGSYNVFKDLYLAENSDAYCEGYDGPTDPDGNTLCTTLIYKEFNSGNNADAITLHSGLYNRVEYSEAFHNSDDGFDGWGSNYTKFSHLISHSNGIYQGDGGGIKTGGDAVQPMGIYAVVDHSLSYENLRNGFNINAGKGVSYLYNVSYNNGRYAFSANESTILVGNIGYNKSNYALLTTDYTSYHEDETDGSWVLPNMFHNSWPDNALPLMDNTIYDAHQAATSDVNEQDERANLIDPELLPTDRGFYDHIAESIYATMGLYVNEKDGIDYTPPVIHLTPLPEDMNYTNVPDFNDLNNPIYPPAHYIVVPKGAKYTEPGFVRAFDDRDGEVEVTRGEVNVDTNTPGTYYVKYSACDSSGNCSVVHRHIIVEEDYSKVIYYYRYISSIRIDGETYTY